MSGNPAFFSSFRWYQYPKNAEIVGEEFQFNTVALPLNIFKSCIQDLIGRGMSFYNPFTDTFPQ